MYEKKYLRVLDAQPDTEPENSPSPARRTAPAKRSSSSRRKGGRKTYGAGGRVGIGSSSEEEAEEDEVPAPSPARVKRPSPGRAASRKTPTASPARRVATAKKASAKASPARTGSLSARRKKTFPKVGGMKSSGDESEGGGGGGGVLSDADIREQFEKLGANCPPITSATRKVITKKLARLIEAQGAKSVEVVEVDDDDDEEVDEDEADIAFVEEDSLVEEDGSSAASSAAATDTTTTAAAAAADSSSAGKATEGKNEGSSMWMVVLALAVAGVAFYLHSASTAASTALDATEDIGIGNNDGHVYDPEV